MCSRNNWELIGAWNRSDLLVISTSVAGVERGLQNNYFRYFVGVFSYSNYLKGIFFGTSSTVCSLGNVC